MLRSQVGRIFFGLFISVLLITQVFPFDIQPVKALGPYEVATGTDKFSTAWESQRKLAIESDGTIHAVYYRTGGSLICQIYHAYSSDDGITWTEEQVTSASRDQVNTALAVDSQDNLHIVWQDGDEGKMGSGDNPVTYYRSKNKQGGWQAAEFVSSYATYPSIAVDSNDDVHVVYGSFVYPPGYWGGGNGIRWKEKTIAGWQTEESLSSNKMWTRWPAIAIDGSDNIHIAWHNAPRATYSDTHYRKRTASGWETEVQVNTELDNVRGKPSIIVDGNNYVHIVWWRETGGMSSIRYRTYTTSWQTPVDIEGPTTYNQSSPVIAIDNLGHIHVAWAGQYADSPTLDQIRHTEYTGSWQPVQNLTSSTSDNQTYPSLLWARYPTISGVPTNQPENGFSLIWNDGSVIRFYTNTDPVVTFPDANLEAAIREALPKPVGDIYASDLASLIHLYANDSEIVNLSGLEYCTNLYELWLSNNQIVDLTPLAGLTSLNFLNLSENQISNLTPLAGLTNLQVLVLQINQISDLSPLVNLTNLIQLFLNSNQISDITPLSGLTSLNNLGLSGNQISDLTPLAGLTNLTELFLDYNQISDMTPLAGLTNLNTLYIYNNQISDLSPVAGLTNLIILHLDRNQISNLTPLTGLTKLQSLFLGNNQISDLTPLAGLTSLSTLHLSGNQISNLTPVAGLTNLQILYLGSNQISDLSPLAGLTSLNQLSLITNQISDLSPLVGLTSLKILWLNNNPISDIAPLVGNAGISAGDEVYLYGNPLGHASINVHIPALQARGASVFWDDPVVTFPDANLEAAIREALPKPVGDIYASELAGLTGLNASNRGIINLSGLEYCTNLTLLYLWSNQISNLAPLAGLTNLNYLNLGPNQISDLAPLTGLINLNDLYLGGNQISNLAPLAGLTKLTELGLGGNQISDLAPLAGLTNLTWLYLGENQINNLSPLAGLTNLNYLNLGPNQISDLSPLAGLTSLTNLSLDDNQISDLSPLAGLISLTHLGLSYNQISDLTPLAGLTSLTMLSLDDNQISDLSPLAGLISLTHLGLSYNQISDLTPLAGLTNLTTLFLCNNQISDIAILVGLTKLAGLVLDGNQISDLSPLAGLANLFDLQLGYNQINDLTPLAGLTILQWLNLSNNQVSDIATLVDNTGISVGDTVDLRSNPLSQTSINIHISALLARGVTVFWDDVAPATIVLVANPKSITANGSSTSTITATVKDDSGNNVPDGTAVIFTTSAGSIGSTTTTKSTTNGVATATLTSSTTDGVATVTATSDNVSAATAVFFTRPGVTVTDFIEEETPPGQYTVDAKSLGDIEVIKSGDGTPTVTVAKYSGNPAGPTPGGFSAAGDYVDVHLSSTDNVTQIEIRKYYTDDEIRGMRETTLRMRWWSGSGWVECSNSGVNTNDVNGYSGYVWAIITDDTTPSLADLSGGMFAAMSTATIAPSAPPSPSASRASPTPQRPLNPAQMSLQYLSISPQQTFATQPLTISTNVVNTGDESGNINVALKINGKVEQARTVSVGPRGTQPVKFTVSRAQPGTYTVDIGGQKGSFTVLGAYSSNSGASTAAGLIATLIAGLLVIVVVMLFRRRAY